jgi:GntR family transcriptional regulator/MocR family aminotransferase
MYTIDQKRKTPLHVQLFNEIKKEIMTTSNIGDKLSSIRKIANTYNLSRNTVQTAYNQLCIEGYIKNRPRSGYYVIDTSKDIVFEKSTAYENKSKNIKPYKYDFFPARLCKKSFPMKIWKRLCIKALSGDIDMGGYCDDYGEFGLRDQIAKYLMRSRGVRCHPDQIIVCSGFLDSIELLAKTLKDKYNSFAIEHPGYHLARRAFESFGYKIQKIAVNKDGLVLEQLIQSDARIVYITPSHQYPTGVSMPITHRHKLLQWAKSVDGIIIEDDYDSELTYNNHPIPSLQGLDAQGRVVYCGTFAKSLSPSLRVSYIVLPDILIKLLEQPYDTIFPKVSLPIQKTLELFLKDGHYDRHIRKIRTINKKRHDCMKAELIKKLGKTFKIEAQGAGLAILINPSVPFDFEQLKNEAEREGIKLYFSKYSCGDEWDALRMGFGGLDVAEIKEAVEHFAIIWHNSIKKD